MWAGERGGGEVLLSPLDPDVGGASPLLIPYSAIVKTILVRSFIFNIFTRVENQPLKQGLKQKRRIIFKNLQNTFSFA